ncbi:ImmA/IrrE family metallo-endopeptidase [Duganella sp. FT135W]|uniref:ImmA/IrrE family metallo-endopeptidase n=1 Tax=Duganella flavida TaxID=2692175 RepID=A0A6L8K6K3_9BURK|nr:ImmA/IrrE family metallo-endopeptidase [Duganella flavida]MYM22880.1 ImmA/IrrE family metallo-endopeptidase [Duganella flavida]
MANNADEFRIRLAKSTGLTDSAIRAAWPEWWSEAADASPSAQAELRFSLARNLGLDPVTVLDDQFPKFIWDDSAKYKSFKGDDERDKPAITAFGKSVTRMLVKSVAQARPLVGMPASQLRQSILRNNQYVGLIELLATLWAVGVPVLHLRVFPLPAKRMSAMATSFQDRHAILLAKDSTYPAAIAFNVAHEIGHIACGHVTAGSALIDMDHDGVPQEQDGEELEADKYALELLTGDPEFQIEKQGQGRSARDLAKQVLAAGPEMRIEPGTMALCYGFATGEWPTAQGALGHIYDNAIPAWEVVNKIAMQQMDWTKLSDESTHFLKAVMGAPA